MKILEVATQAGIFFSLRRGMELCEIDLAQDRGRLL
jgi:hypothetical protein